MDRILIGGFGFTLTLGLGGDILLWQKIYLKLPLTPVIPIKPFGIQGLKFTILV
jgi:hypothetical protein